MATTHTSDRSMHAGTNSRFAGGWGPVLSGGTAAFLTFIAFSALWLAITASGVEWVGNNLQWFEVATSFVAAIVGGFVAGWLQPRDARTGTVQGLAAWGLVLFAGMVVGVPSVTAIFSGATNMTLQSLASGGNVSNALSQLGTELWASFAVFAGGGLIAALTGGAASAMSPSHDDELTATRVSENREVNVRDREEVTAGSR